VTSLTTLTQLFIDGNVLDGNPLPTVNQMTQLDFLYLEENFFRGAIDENFCKGFDKVLTIDISENNFTLADNTFPVHLFALPKLIILDMSDNDMDGTLPATIPVQKKLHLVALHKNQLSGKVPGSFTNLGNLQHIDLSNNDFTGAMPTDLFNMTSLYHIYLSENNFTAGRIPHMNATMDQLREISLKNTNRVGPLPTFHNFTGLFMIDFDNNRLNGTVPDHYGKLPALRHLLLNRNPDLSGNLPIFSEPSNLGTVLLDKTGIVGDFSSVCNLPTISGKVKIPTDVIVLADCEDNAAITCKCCECCRKDQAECSAPIVTSLDWTWENGFHRAARDFAIDEKLFADDSSGVTPQ
jgi:Leucine-rich repeat (LRR) protein